MIVLIAFFVKQLCFVIDTETHFEGEKFEISMFAQKAQSIGPEGSIKSNGNTKNSGVVAKNVELCLPTTNPQCILNKKFSDHIRDTYTQMVNVHFYSVEVPIMVYLHCNLYYVLR